MSSRCKGDGGHLKDLRDKRNNLNSKKKRLLDQLKDIQHSKNGHFEKKRQKDLDLAVVNKEITKKNNALNTIKNQLQYHTEQPLIQAKKKLEQNLQRINYDSRTEKRIVSEIDKLNRNIRELPKLHTSKKNLEDERAKHQSIKLEIAKEIEFINTLRQREYQFRSELNLVMAELKPLTEEFQATRRGGDGSPNSPTRGTSTPVSSVTMWGPARSHNNNNTPVKPLSKDDHFVTSTPVPLESEPPVRPDSLAIMSTAVSKRPPVSKPLTAPERVDTPRGATGGGKPPPPMCELKGSAISEETAEKVCICQNLISSLDSLPVPKTFSPLTPQETILTQQPTASVSKRHSHPGKRFRGLTLPMTVFCGFTELDIPVPVTWDQLEAAKRKIISLKDWLLSGPSVPMEALSAGAAAETVPSLERTISTTSTAGDSAFSELPVDHSRPDSPSSILLAQLSDPAVQSPEGSAFTPTSSNNDEKQVAATTAQVSSVVAAHQQPSEATSSASSTETIATCTSANRSTPTMTVAAMTVHSVNGTVPGDESIVVDACHLVTKGGDETTELLSLPSLDSSERSLSDCAYESA